MVDISHFITIIESLIGCTQILFSTGIERFKITKNSWLSSPEISTINDVFHHLIPLMIIRYQNISLDVTDGWNFSTWQLWMPPSIPVPLSNWVGLLSVTLTTWKILLPSSTQLSRNIDTKSTQLACKHRAASR